VSIVVTEVIALMQKSRHRRYAIFLSDLPYFMVRCGRSTARIIVC